MGVCNEDSIDEEGSMYSDSSAVEQGEVTRQLLA